MLKVLMLGTARDVKGGITSVVEGYYDCGLDKEIALKYIETTNDKSKFSKLVRMILGFLSFIFNIYKYDIIHLHMSHRMSTYRKCIYILLSKIIKKKVIVHVHGSEFDIFYDTECNNMQKKIIKKILNLSDKIIVLSEEWKKYFSNIVSNSKIEIIHNAIMIPRDFKKNINTCNFLFLGILGKRKGIYDLIDVFEKIIKENNDVKLFIGGNGEVEKVKEIIRTKKIENNIIYVGWVKNKEKEKLLKECSFYILPSYNEGMPISVLEGMAYKNVTISTNVGGIPQIIKNLENGIIIQPGDKNDLYKNIKLLLDNKKLREKLSENAYKTIKNDFNLKKNINLLLKLYKNIIKDNVKRNEKYEKK